MALRVEYASDWSMVGIYLGDGPGTGDTACGEVGEGRMMEPADIAGATMRPNSLALDDQAMKNVVAYIQTLQ